MSKKHKKTPHKGHQGKATVDPGEGLTLAQECENLPALTVAGTKDTQS